MTSTPTPEPGEPCELCIAGEQAIAGIYCDEDHTPDAIGLARTFAEEFETADDPATMLLLLDDAIGVIGALRRENAKATGPWEVDPLGKLGRWDPLFIVSGLRFGVEPDADCGCGDPPPPARVTDADIGEWIDEGGLI